MGDKTGIGWTDSTWNFFVGCSLKGAGCTNCYAMLQAHEDSGPGGYYEGLTRISGGRPVWVGKTLLKPDKLIVPFRKTKPRMYFVNSMSDMFHETIPFEYVAAGFGIMAASPQHQFQVLTKRPRRMLEFFDWLEENVHKIQRTDAFCALQTAKWLGHDGAQRLLESEGWREKEVWPLPNVWLGVSASTQEAADDRVPLLLQAPAAIRFVSAEPLLEKIDLKCLHYNDVVAIDALTGESGVPYPHAKSGPGLDWVIVGGESGPRARPCKQEWVEFMVKQCQESDVSVFMKQKGSTWARECGSASPKGDIPEEFPKHLQVQQFPSIRTI